MGLQLMAANIPIAKVEYLVELMEIKKLYQKYRRTHEIKISRTYSINQESRNKFETKYEEIYGWENLKPEYVNLFQSKFTEAEINKLLAIYELKESKKLLDNFKFSEDEIIKNFFDSSKNLKKFNESFNPQNQIF